MSSQQYDMVVLGGGIGGYSAAIRAAQLGMSVAIVEKDKLGGTCLHRGCIPSKSLLRSAELLATMKKSDTYGIIARSVEVDFAKVLERKNRIVEQLYNGLGTLMKKYRIDVIRGEGRVIGPSIFSPKSGAIAVQQADEEEEGTILVPRYLIIATGSRARMLPGWENDPAVMTSDEALRMEKLPSSILIVGGGVIGLEWASMLHDFGVKVTVVESQERLVPTEDEAISRAIRKQLEQRGVTVFTAATVNPESKREQNGEVAVTIEMNGQSQVVTAEQILVSIGRAPNTERIGLENTGVNVERTGIKVNKHMQTAESHIYAIGDCIGGQQLAHVAAHQGVLAVEHIAGLRPEPFAEERVPRCIYSRPEMAATGWTERQARERGYDVKSAVFPFSALGKAWVNGETDGFVKVVSDRTTGDLLGVHMIGPHVTELVSEAALAQLLDATPWEVASSIHPHPSLSEAIGEAMAAIDEKSVGI